MFSFAFPFTRGPRGRIKYGGSRRGSFRAREGGSRWERGRRQVGMKKMNLKEEAEENTGKRR